LLIEVEDELEELVDHLAWAATQSPKVRASLRELSEAAWSWLGEMQARGHLRVVRAADGSIAVELLQRSVH
jgi:hypothetical protein